MQLKLEAATDASVKIEDLTIAYRDDVALSLQK